MATQPSKNTYKLAYNPKAGPEPGMHIATTHVYGLATTELPNGVTYTFFYATIGNDKVLSYLVGPLEDGTYQYLTIKVDKKMITTPNNNAPLASAMEGNTIHVFYLDINHTIQELLFDLPTKTWKYGTIGDQKYRIPTSSVMSAAGSPALKVTFISIAASTNITEAYYTAGTWSSVLI